MHTIVVYVLTHNPARAFAHSLSSVNAPAHACPPALQALSYNIPTDVQLVPPHPIYAQYNLTDFAFAADANITTRAVASLYTWSEDSNEREYVYVDQDTVETALFPPIDAWKGAESHSTQSHTATITAHY
jgi:hypothetical protein